MRHALLILSVVGFFLCFWSVAASLGRPTSFELLAEAVQQAEVSPDARQLIEFRIQELRRSHSAEVGAYVTAHHIALAGLGGLSVCSLLFYVYSRRKCA